MPCADIEDVASEWAARCEERQREGCASELGVGFVAATREEAAAESDLEEEAAAEGDEQGFKREREHSFFLNKQIKSIEFL